MITLYTPGRCVALCAMLVLAYAWLWPAVGLDQIIFLQPWLDSIQASDGLAIFATPFTNYTGGYVGVLWGWSLAGPLLSDQAILKLASLTGTALLALSAGLLLRRAGCHHAGLAWVIAMGREDWSIASKVERSAEWLMSTTRPTRFISSTACLPNRVRPVSSSS